MSFFFPKSRLLATNLRIVYLVSFKKLHDTSMRCVGTKNFYGRWSLLV